MVRRPVLFTLVLCLVAACAAAPASALTATPIVLKAGMSLKEQFGYAPPYVTNVPAFDPAGNVFIRSRTASQDDTAFVQEFSDGVWVRHGFLEALRDAYPDLAGTVNAGGWATDRIQFDADGRAYTVLTVRLEEGEFRNVMLYSLDGCETWKVAELPFGDAIPLYDWRMWGNVTMEHHVGQDPLAGPPLLALWRQVAPWTGVWSSVNELYVLQPRLEGDVLVVPEPVLVTTRHLGAVYCAGGSSFAVTAGRRTFFAYAEVAPRGSLTTPTYVAWYDHDTGTVSPGVYIGGAKPANDSHCTPGICIDRQGFLHVLMSSHGWSFKYSRSVLPWDGTTWTRPIPVCTSGLRVKGTDRDGRGNQTYVSLVCGPDGTLHLVFRQMRAGVDAYFQGRRYAALSYQRLAPGGAWSKPKILVVGAYAGYGQFYQKLAIDPAGRLYVSCSYWSDKDPLSTRLYRRFHHRMILTSTDGGGSWRLADTEDFEAAAVGDAAW